MSDVEPGPDITPDDGPGDGARNGAGDDVPTPVRAASGIIALEGLALVAGGVFLVYETIFGHPGAVLRSLLAALMAFIGALALFAGARGLLLLRSGARSPMVVIQVLALPVGYSLGIQAGRIGYGGPILVAAIAVLYLLFTPPARAALDRAPID